KIDAIVYVGGIMIGIFIFSELYPLFQPIYEGYFYGNVTLEDSLGINPYWFVFIFSIIAIVAFVISDMVQKRVKKIFY
ncbi:MAG: sulfurtransferase, partial [Lutibacter sp.]|nr:sulfurtransferase [Lutibacter sp.]